MHCAAIGRLRYPGGIYISFICKHYTDFDLRRIKGQASL